MTTLSRVRRRLKGAPRIEVNTVVSPADYRITFRLGDVDLVFNNAANTAAGRKERLQVLGLLPYPLDHPDADRCFQFVWNNYIKKMFAAVDPALDAATMSDGKTDQLIKEALESFLVSNGALPAVGNFAKLRIPGDYRVLHRDFDEKFFTEPQFTLSKGNRYDVERRFCAANPALGKIPIVAKVEIRPKGGGEWRPVIGINVFFQLREPDDLPKFADTANASEIVAGALSWTDSVAGAALRASGGKTLKNTRPGKNRKQGPAGYLESYALNRQNDDKFLKSPSADPQRRNHFWKFGGKRYLASATTRVHEKRLHKGELLDNVFMMIPVGTFNDKYPQALDIGDPERLVSPHSVIAKTNAEGEAGVVFAPSRIGGDRYKLRAFLFTKRGKKVKADTGTMVRWRTLRISRALTVKPPADGNGFDKTIENELQPYFGDCQHASKFTGRFCAECLLREGECPSIDYAAMAREFSKSYCELLIDGNAEQSFHKIFDRQAVEDAAAEFALKLKNNEQFAGVMDFSEPFALTDGKTKTFTGTLTAKGTIVPRHVKIKVGNEFVAIDKGDGTFIETGSTMNWKPGGVDLNGTVDYASGKLTINFAEPPPAGKDIFVGVKLKTAIDWRSLLYYAENSPFLLNLHTPQAYNSLIDPEKFAPIVSRTTGSMNVGTCDGVQETFTVDLPPGVSKWTVKADGKDIAGSEFVARINRQSGRLEVVSIAPKTEKFDYDGKNGAPFRATLKDVPQRGEQLFNIKITQGTEIKGFAFVRNDLQAVISCAGQDRAGFRYNEETRELQIEFVGERNDFTAVTIEYSGKSSRDKINLTVDYEADTVYNTGNAKPVGGGPSSPGGTFLPHVNKAINWYFLIYVVRRIEKNQGFMPGLILIRSPLRDTWSGIWDSKGMHQGKGVCNGFFLFYGNQWRTGGYNAQLEKGDGTVSQPGIYPSLLMHEMSHCLYVNHFPSGTPMASGARTDQHDMFDSCLMGYGQNNDDFCGQCVAGFMGLDTANSRLLTWKGKRMLRTDSEIESVADEKLDPSKIRHVEPPEIAKPAGYADGDDVMSLLEACPFAKQVYDDAMAANGGIPPNITPAPEGRGSCDHVNGDVGYPMLDRIKLEDKDQLVSGAVERITSGGVRTQEVSGPDIGVQILVMELSNLKHRFDFFDHDAKMRRGKMGHNKFIEETERVEYDGGVRNVIQAYRQCNPTWNARICVKKKAEPYMHSFKEYFDSYLDPTHKGSYSEVWYTQGARSWYYLRVPRMKHFTNARIDSIVAEIIRKKFSGLFKLDSDDNAIWNLLNILFAIDPDFDGGGSDAMSFAENKLKELEAQTSAMEKVKAVYQAATLRYPSKTIPQVVER